MKPEKVLFVLFLGALSVVSSGCMSDLVLQFNGQSIEVQTLRESKFPRGLEIESYNGRLMKVNGREAIVINGKKLSVSGTDVNYGANSAKLDPKTKFVIRSDGQFSIVKHSGPPGKSSWWAFWR